MEALAAGLPVIATAESGFPISDGKTGFIVKAKNVDEIVNRIMQLWESKELRENMGKAAATMIREQYTWEKYAESVVNIYNEMLG